MKKTILAIVAFAAAGLIFGLHPTRCDAQSQESQAPLPDLAVAQIALMPFLMGQLESPNAPMVKPLNKSFAQLEIDSQEILADADRVMTRIVNAEFKLRVEERLVAPDRVAEAYRTLVTDPALDTPCKRAVNLGEALDAQVVMVGTVLKYRERGALVDMPDSAASVGFALYLIDTQTGVRFWRGAFDGTQKALTQDVLGGLKHLEMGLRWLSAEELTRYGVKLVLRKLKLN